MSEFDTDYSGLPSQESLELAREVAIARHPGAEKFRDLLTGPDLESVIALAKDVEQRMSPAANTGPTSTATRGEGETPPALQQQEQGPSSTSVIEDVRRGRVHPNDPDALRAFFSARLAEAGRGEHLHE